MKERPALIVNQWLASVPAERKDAINAVRDAINAHLPQGYEETVDWACSPGSCRSSRSRTRTMVVRCCSRRSARTGSS